MRRLPIPPRPIYLDITSRMDYNLHVIRTEGVAKGLVEYRNEVSAPIFLKLARFKDKKAPLCIERQVRYISKEKSDD